VHVADRLTRRLQILLDEERYQRLGARAAREGTSVGAYVRDAIDRQLGDGDDRASEALDSFLAATPFEVGEPGELTRELEDAYQRRPGDAA